MIVLGIDPGKSGGLALVKGTLGQRPRLIKCARVPVAPPDSDDLLDVDAIISFVQSEPPDAAYIERVTPMPSTDKGERRGMGATSAFNFGGAVYTLRTCLVGLGIPLRRVEPRAWKKLYGLSSRELFTDRKFDQREVKEQSRQKAISLFGAEHFPRIGDHNVAEAALIANYGLKISGGS